MSTYEALTLMISFTSLTVSVIMLSFAFSTRKK